jgi:hypothetical protein
MTLWVLSKQSSRGFDVGGRVDFLLSFQSLGILNLANMEVKIYFQFYGVRVLVEAEEKFARALDHLREDFHSFFSNPGEDPDLLLQLKATNQFGQQARNHWHRKRSLMKTKMCEAKGFRQRCCRFDEDHWVELREGQMLIYGSNIEFIYEISFVLLLSRVCEEIEKKHGWLRMHGMSYVGDQGQAAHAILMPSGGGKSVLTMQAVQAGFKVLTDEIVWTDGSRIFPFPMRIALKSEAQKYFQITESRVFHRQYFEHKHLLSLSQQSIGEETPIGKVFWAWQGPDFTYGTASVLTKLKFLFSTMLGLGLPQMREYFLRLENLPWLPRLAILRLRIALKLVLSREFRTLQIKRNSFENFAMLSTSVRDGHTLPQIF